MCCFAGGLSGEWRDCQFLRRKRDLVVLGPAARTGVGSGEKCDPGNDYGSGARGDKPLPGTAPLSGLRQPDECTVIRSGQAVGTANLTGCATPSGAVPLIEPRQ
ncbi:hypothetical protein A5753_18625 [Mycobacterium sp. 852002-51971_SCH5477799-a]|nr:hypothetical protein A5753_18625 [Mycobacterium sp. 852002-51971_SCH5477799-a]